MIMLTVKDSNKSKNGSRLGKDLSQTPSQTNETNTSEFMEKMKELYGRTKPSYKVDSFALNTKVNCDPNRREFCPQTILNHIMPWKPEDEMAQESNSELINFNSHLRSQQFRCKAENELKKEIRIMHDKLRIKQCSPVSEESPIKPKLNNKATLEITIFDDIDAMENKGSRFNNSVQSEDDSPDRRDRLKSPKKPKKFCKMLADQIQNESKEVEVDIKKQLEEIRELRRQTIQGISGIKETYEKYDSAQKSLQERLTKSV